MGKKMPESERKLKNIKREKYKTSTDCIACLKNTKGCDRGRLYVSRLLPGKAYKYVPCFR